MQIYARKRQVLAVGQPPNERHTPAVDVRVLKIKIFGRLRRRFFIGRNF